MLEVPRRTDLPKILVVFHGSRFVGHFCIKSTLQRLHESYHWKSMVHDVTKFCQECKVCQVKQVYPKTISIQELNPIPITEAFARVGIDILGPLVTTIEEHKFLVVATDYLIKWVEVRPLASKDADNVVQFVFD